MNTTRKIYKINVKNMTDTEANAYIKKMMDDFHHISLAPERNVEINKDDSSCVAKDIVSL